MRFEAVQNLKEEEFRRLTGVKRETFNKMAEIVEQALPGKKSRGGRPNRLSSQDMVLMWGVKNCKLFPSMTVPDFVPNFSYYPS